MRARDRPADEQDHPSLLAYVSCYVLFFVLLALCYGLFLVWRITTPLIVALIFGDGESVPAIYGVLMVLVALALFGVVMAGEPYLRHGVERGELRARFVALAGPVVGLAALGLAVQELLRLLL